MRAARYYGRGDVRIEEVPEPVTGPGQVKIAPAFAGICGSDLHEYQTGPHTCPTSEHVLTKEKIPVTLGHEFSGVITEVGEGVTSLKVGQACTVRPSQFCGHCVSCEAQAENVCESFGFIGITGGGGGLSDAICVDETKVLALPENVTLEAGALVEPLAVAWHAVSEAPNLGSESVVVIIGAGPIGLATLLCLRAKGVERIIMLEVATVRQEYAQRLGATKTLNPIKDDVKGAVLDLSAKRGADAVFDCAGVPTSIKTSCFIAKAKGTIVNVAIWGADVAFNPNWLTMKELTYKSVLSYRRKDFDAVIENLRKGTIEPEGMITKKIKLEDLVEGGIKALSSRDNQHVKILIKI